MRDPRHVTQSFLVWSGILLLSVTFWYWVVSLIFPLRVP